MTKREILFNYNQAIRQAEKLEQLAQRLGRLSSERMEDAIGQLKIAWQSDSSPQYYEKMGKVQWDIRDTSKEIDRIARDNKDAAEAMKKAELRALEIATSRTYK